MNGRQVRLFLADGTVGGLMTAEILNWTGHILRGKRKDLARMRKREEAARTGIYILFGTNDEGDATAYIGESDNVVKRLESHNATKPFWDDVVIITSKDLNLTKAHARFLEAELIRIAKDVGRVHLDNGTAPIGGAALPEADESDMRYFIAQIRILMPVLGFDIFRGRTSTHDTNQAPPLDNASEPDAAESLDVSEKEDSPTFFLRSTDGVDAQARVIDGEFTVLTGSLIRREMRLKASAGESTRRQFAMRSTQHEKILELTLAGPKPSVVRLTKDVAFTSPSTAAAVALGRASSNGRTEWKLSDGRTYGSWESSEAGA